MILRYKYYLIQEETDLERTLTATNREISEVVQSSAHKLDYTPKPSNEDTEVQKLRASVSSDTIKSEISEDADTPKS